MFGDKFSLVDRPRKHRYIYFNCSKTRKKQLLKKLKYKIYAYPKNNKIWLLYTTSHKPFPKFLGETARKSHTLPRPDG